ncbi:MAG TPA: DUF1559 domain-containing protein [Tepidisphaeraceae bacterium]|jgi:prepilin-type N-terminal cleavage/methylation domain-containing protein|nr:DUF1559 domain-containing protein [Tepidisphaeraceae bacterium]
MSRTPTSEHRHGFTLVELLVVIGIIALLISILLPAMNKARISARLLVCQSNARQIGVALQAYASEHRGFFPAARGQDYEPVPGGEGYSYKGTGWDEAIAGNLGTRVTWNVNAAPPIGDAMRVWQCPFDEERGSAQGASQRRSYWLNTGNRAATANTSSPAWDADEAINSVRIKPSGSRMSGRSDIAILGCRRSTAASISNTFGYNANNQPAENWPSEKGSATALASMHPLKVPSRSLLFLDGRVTVIRWDEFGGSSARQVYMMYDHPGWNDGK